MTMLVVYNVASVETVGLMLVRDGVAMDRVSVNEVAADRRVVEEISEDETSIDEVASDRFGVAEVLVEKIAIGEDVVDIATVDEIVLGWDKEAEWPPNNVGERTKEGSEEDREVAGEFPLAGVEPLTSGGTEDRETVVG